LAAFEVSVCTIGHILRRNPPRHLIIVSFPTTRRRAPARPVTMSGKARRQAGLVLTSLDEERRRQAVVEALRSLDVGPNATARECSCFTWGKPAPTQSWRITSSACFAEGRIASPEADAVRSRLIVERAHQRRGGWFASWRSLDEFDSLRFGAGVRLGLENRPR